MKVLDQAIGNKFALYHGDSAEVLRGVPANSVGYSIFSPPFSSLFCYSCSDRDVGNVRDYEEFREHFSFLLPELLRVLMPGRSVSIHCMQLQSLKERDGHIGLIDFRGLLVRAAQEAGFIYHAEVCIAKDPIVAAQRTKSIRLLYKQLRKDSAMSGMGLPDYLMTFRKPGANPEPITHTYEEFTLKQWQHWANPVWNDINPSDTLQRESAREEKDERHIAPLQLEVIRRGVRLWSNPGDVVLTPFLGIGSEAYVALQEGRRAVGVELKASYFKQAVANCQSVENQNGKQVSLFGAGE